MNNATLRRNDARKLELQTERYANIDTLLEWEDQFEELGNNLGRDEKLAKRRAGRMAQWTEERVMTERKATEMYPTDAI